MAFNEEETKKWETLKEQELMDVVCNELENDPDMKKEYGNLYNSVIGWLRTLNPNDFDEEKPSAEQFQLANPDSFNKFSDAIQQLFDKYNMFQISKDYDAP